MAAPDTLFYVFLPDGMVIFVCIVFCISRTAFQPVEIVGFILLPVQIDRVGDFFVHSLGTSDRKAAAVISRQGGVQSEHNGLSSGAFDDRSNHISLSESPALQELVIALMVTNIIPQPCSLGSGGG